MAEIKGYGSKRSHEFKLTVNERANSMDIANNTTIVDFSFTIYKTSYSWSQWNSITYTVTIDGTNYTGTIPAYSAGSVMTIRSGSQTIPHDSNGSRSISCSFSVNDATGQSYTCGNASGNGTVVLSTVPRASGIDEYLRVTEYLDTTYVVKFTPKASSFYYRLRVSIPEVIAITHIQIGNKPVAQQQVQFSFTSKQLTTILNKVSGTSSNVRIGVVIETYSDSGYTNKVGESSEPVLVMTLPLSVKPVVSSVTLKENSSSGVPSSWGVYVQNKSKIDFSIAASGVYSSTIISYQININGTSYIAQSGTTGVLLQSGTNSYSVTVTDSRGRTGTANGTFNVTAYSPPAITTFTAVRCNSAGTENEEGNYAKVVLVGSISSISSKNTYSYTLQYKKTSATSYTTYSMTNNAYTINKTITNIAVDTDSSYDFLFTIKDYFGSVSRTVSIATAFALMNFKASGKGMAIGKVSETDNLLDINMNTRIRGTLQTDKTINGTIDKANKDGKGHEINTYYFKNYTRDMCASNTNLDNPGINGLFELRNSELAYTGTKPLNSYYPFLNLKTPDNIAMLQIAGLNGDLYYRAKQASNVTMSGTPWAKIRDSGNWGVILYDSSPGANGSLTLSQSSSNFSYLEIYFRLTTSGVSYNDCTKVFDPNGKKVSLNAVSSAINTSYIDGAANATISGNTITLSNNATFYSNGDKAAAMNEVWIRKVVGYR